MYVHVCNMYVQDVRCVSLSCMSFVADRWSTWVVRVGALYKIFNPHSQLSRLDHLLSKFVVVSVCVSF